MFLQNLKGRKMRSLKKTKERRGYTTQLRGTLRSRLKLLQNAELWMTKDHDIRRNRRIILKSHADPMKDNPLRKCWKVLQTEQPEAPFDCKEPAWNDVVEVVIRVSSRSSLEHNGIPYKVFESYPTLLRWLWKLFKIT